MGWPQVMQRCQGWESAGTGWPQRKVEQATMPGLTAHPPGR